MWLTDDTDDLFTTVACRYDHDMQIAEATITAFVRETLPRGGRPGAERAPEPPADDAGWRRVREVHRERGYALETISRLLGQAGFQQVETFAGLQFAEVRPDTGRAWFVARP